AGFAGHADPIASNIGERLDEIERAHAVPQLKAAEAQAPEVRAAAAEFVRQLMAVVETDHVVGENDEAESRETDRTSGNRCDRGIFESAVRPVSVRREDRRKRSIADRLGEVA